MTDQAARIAFRIEGDWWVAYFALPDSMEGAREIGRIHMNAARNRDRKQMFIDLAQHFIAEALENISGQAVKFNAPVDAPEHERSGRA